MYLTKPLLERMQIKAIIDKIIPERKENGQIVTTGEVSEVLVANRLHHPRPLRDIEEWALVCGIEELSGLAPEHLNDDRLGRALVTFIALLAYCILEHLAKQKLDPKATTNLLMKEFAAIVYSAGEMLDGTQFQTVDNVKDRHIP
ncbi:MAG: DUF4277 domain-containing protein [Bacillota bacterium]|nr:DUF4277 domain-containing protein [Bacillota bacterium]